MSVRSNFLYEEKLVNFANIIKVECQSQMLKSEENVDLDKVEIRQVQVNEAKRNQILSNISYKSFDFKNKITLKKFCFIQFFFLYNIIIVQVQTSAFKATP